MIVDEIDIERMAFLKAKNNAPVPRSKDRPVAWAENERLSFAEINRRHFHGLAPVRQRAIC